MPAPFVNFQNVWLAYNEELLAKSQFAVEDISLQAAEGALIAIVGPSGCGKSTFMKLTTGLKMPSRGRVQVGGAPVTGPLKISGMAFQAPSLPPWRTTVDNVLLPLEIVEPYRSQFKAKRDEYRARQLARRLRGGVPADDGVQRAAEGGVHPDPRRLVRHRRRPGHPDRVPDLVLPDHGQHRDRPGAITLAFVGTTVSEVTASNEGIGYLLISAGSSMQMGLAFAGLVVVGAMAMGMYELVSVVEKRTTAWAHRGSNAA